MDNGKGGWRLDPESIGGRAKEYFEELSTSSSSASPSTQLEGMRRKITNAMNRNLTKPVSENEFKRVVFSIHPFSAPSDYGFNPNFISFIGKLLKGM